MNIEAGQALELHFSSTDEGKEDEIGEEKVIWKDILCEGSFSITPGRNKKVPFSVIPQGSSDASKGVISMSDIIEGFDERAFEDVTIPDGHPKPDRIDPVTKSVIKGDSALNNTGYVRALRTVKKKGKHFLQAALGFTEPEVAGKVKRGTVPNVSSGVFFNFTRKSDDKTFPCVLNHVALTKQPWIPDLDPFKRVFASDDNLADEDFEITSAEFAEDDSDTGSSNTADIVWNEKDGTNWLREALSAALTPDEAIDESRPYVPRPSYYVQDLSQSKGLALVEEYFKGDRTRWVIPFKVNGDEVTPAPAIRWIEGRDALIAASDDKENDKIEFGEFSSGKVLEKINLALEGSPFKAQEVGLDRRALLSGNKGEVFLAQFATFPSGQVLLSPPSDWEVVSTPEKTDAVRPAPVDPVNLSDNIERFFDLNTPEGRVQAARHRRSTSFAGKSK